MFSDNEKISLRQLKRLVVFDLFSLSALIVPQIAVKASGKDGILAILAATVMALIYAWILMTLSKGINGNLLDYAKMKAGRIVTFIIGILFLIKLFVCCVFEARLFSDVINETLLEDTDHRLIILILLLVAAYAASKGFEIRARIAEVLFFIVIVPILFFLLVGLKNVNLPNLMPLFTHSTGNVINGGYLVFLTFSMLELLLFSIPLIHYNKTDMEVDEESEDNTNKNQNTNVKEESLRISNMEAQANKNDRQDSSKDSNSKLDVKQEYKKKNNVFRPVAQAILIVSFINLLYFIVTVGILGEEETKQKLWSSVTIMQIVKMPGGFIHRQDAIILGFWMLSIFTIISGFFYYICMITKQICNISKQNYLLIPFIIFIFAASVTPLSTEEFYGYLEKYMMYIGMPQSILLPALIVWIGKYKKNKVPKSAVRSIFLLLVLSATVSFTGCSDLIEIEDRNFIQSLGIDYNQNQLTVYFEEPDLKTLTKQSSGGSDEKLTIELKGKDFWQIEEEYKLQSNKRLDFSQLKAIVLGKSFSLDTNRMQEFMSYIENKYEISRNTLVFVSETSAGDIYSINGDVNGGIGDFLDRLYRISLSKNGRKEVTIEKLIHAKNSRDWSTIIPVIQAKEKKIQTVGLSIFWNHILSYEIPQVDADYIDLANGNGKNSTLFLRYQNNSDENNPDYVVKINNITRKMDFTWNHQKPYLTMTIKGDAILEKSVKNFQGITKKEKESFLKEIESLCNEQMKSNIISHLDRIMKTTKIDFLNLYQMTSYKNKRIWMNYRNNMDQFINDLGYSVIVEMSIEK